VGGIWLFLVVFLFFVLGLFSCVFVGILCFNGGFLGVVALREEKFQKKKGPIA